MVCYVFNYTVLAGLGIDGCFEILRVDDKHCDFR